MNYIKNKKSKCDFCKYWTGRSCMVNPSTFNCRDAANEYFTYIQNNKTHQQPQKSLRNWDKK